ncbi:uncharacterized protein LOC135137774 isoform X2 [Zophobas morio]|uniref:uncharacterized protein LOC135137774 isoform X2 n=1 Tax=Zophobas morio TaxID=2755281 RepID=UPI003083BFC8
MAKRSACSVSCKNLVTKNVKVNDSSDFWEDDLDEDAIDDCFKKATQEAAADVSLMSSYNSVFKKPKHMLTSTQYSQPALEKQVSIEERIRKLEEKYSAKEGEASILRLNLQNLRTSCQLDQEQKDLQWKEKLSIIEKENKTIKSDLEFKNFEIVNLKQQIAELSKLVDFEQRVTQRLQISNNKVHLISPEENIYFSYSGNDRIFISLQKCYPLKSFDLSFTQTKDSKVLQNINYKKNGDQQKGTFSSLTVDSIMSSLLKEITSLVKLSSEDLNCHQANHSAIKVVDVLCQLLKIFQDYFKEIENNCGPFHETREQGVQYSLNNGLQRLSLFCTEVIRFLQELLPFNTFLETYLVMQPATHFESTRITQSFANVTESICWIPLSHIISIIGKTKQEKTFNKFLLTVMKLLCRIFSSEDSTHLKQNTQVNILQELLILNLDFQLMQQMNVLLNVIVCSHNLSYTCLFNHENLNSRCSNEDTLLKNEKSDEFSDFISTILNLTHNILKANKTYECICKLYKLSIGIIYKNLKIHEISPRKAGLLLKNYVEVLSLIIFNAYDVTQKYVVDYAQIKEIMYTIISINGKINDMNLKKLDKLGATEDSPLIAREKFNLVTL